MFYIITIGIIIVALLGGFVAGEWMEFLISRDKTLDD